MEKKGDALEAQKDVKAKTDYELQVELKERIRNMLENEQKIPRELIFVGRAQRITQSLNQIIGSPSPRLNISAHVSPRPPQLWLSVY